MAKLSAQVLDKRIVLFRHTRSSFYSAVFRIANYPNDIAMNLGTSGKAEADSVLRLVQVGNSYIFYIDPSVPVVNGVTLGLNRIDDNSKLLYVKSRRFEIFSGVLFALFGLSASIAAIIYKRKKAVLT